MTTTTTDYEDGIVTGSNAVTDGGPDFAQMALNAARAEPDDRASFRRYRVTVLVDHSETVGAPVVFEDHPNHPNLVGRVEHIAQLGTLVTDFSPIRAGALHRANGGYLVLDARRVLTEPYAWDELKRALRGGMVRIETLGERMGLVSTVSLEPEPVPLDVKVVRDQCKNKNLRDAHLETLIDPGRGRSQL